MRLFRWKHIVDLDSKDGTDIYLSRLMLLKTRWFGLYLHIIRRPDYARCEHDHPWAFWTLILKGGYEEEVQRVLHVRKPGFIGYRPRKFEHRITRLLDGPAVTLVLRGYDHVDWGFKTIMGKVRWQDYISWPGVKRVLWCDDRTHDERRRVGGPLSRGPLGLD